MDINDQVPILVCHIFEGNIAEDTGIVEENVNSTEGLDCCLDDLVTRCDRVVVGYRFAASGFDLVDDNIGSLWNVLVGCFYAKEGMSELAYL